MQKLYEDGTKDDENKEKKMADGRVSSEMRRITLNIKELEQCIKSVELEKQYIPNSESHLRKYSATIDGTQMPFTCDITEEVIENIMLIDDVEDIWKILLMMGIGAFMLHNSDSYIEIMKNLAQEQKLYMIIAALVLLQTLRQIACFQNLLACVVCLYMLIIIVIWIAFTFIY